MANMNRGRERRHTNDYAEQVTRERERSTRKSCRNAASKHLHSSDDIFLVSFVYLNGAAQYSRCRCRPRAERRRGRGRRRRRGTAPPALAWICHTASISASPWTWSTPWDGPEQHPYFKTLIEAAASKQAASCRQPTSLGSTRKGRGRGV